jgi:hypothetical protein
LGIGEKAVMQLCTNLDPDDWKWMRAVSYQSEMTMSNLSRIAIKLLREAMERQPKKLLCGPSPKSIRDVRLESKNQGIRARMHRARAEREED